MSYYIIYVHSNHVYSRMVKVNCKYGIMAHRDGDMEMTNDSLDVKMLNLQNLSWGSLGGLVFWLSWPFSFSIISNHQYQWQVDKNKNQTQIDRDMPRNLDFGLWSLDFFYGLRMSYQLDHSLSQRLVKHFFDNVFLELIMCPSSCCPPVFVMSM